MRASSTFVVAGLLFASTMAFAQAPAGAPAPQAAPAAPGAHAAPAAADNQSGTPAEVQAKPKSDVPKPSADAIRSVWDFHYNGQGGGLVLVDAKLCTAMGKAGDRKAECADEVGDGGVKAGTLVYVWQAYLIPHGDSIEDLTVQLKQGDVVRETKDVAKLKGESIRTRTWQAFRLPKAGDWTITLARGSETLKTLTVKAH